MKTHSTFDDSIEATTTVDAQEWDRFLESVPDSHHLQSSLWAELKSPSGWQASRLALRENNKIVAGLQILQRPLSKFGRFGYAPRGPVFAGEDPRLPPRLMAEFETLVRAKQFRYVTVQPPRVGASFVKQLTAKGFSSAPFQAAPTATVLIDVQQPSETLFAGLRSGTRAAVRAGLANDLKVRTGNESDLPAFHSLLVATGQRHGFTPPALDYFRRMWRLFAPSDDIVLFVAEVGSEPVSAELDVTFGDTLVSKRAGWSGAHRKLHPNELVVWTALNWARERGLKYYDMEGFDPDLAHALARGETLPDEAKRTHHWFKLGFGGKVTLLPDNYEIVRVPLLGWAHRNVWFNATSLGFRRWLLKKLGLRWSV